MNGLSRRQQGFKSPWGRHLEINAENLHSEGSRRFFFFQHCPSLRPKPRGLNASRFGAFFYFALPRSPRLSRSFSFSKNSLLQRKSKAKRGTGAFVVQCLRCRGIGGHGLMSQPLGCSKRIFQGAYLRK